MWVGLVFRTPNSPYKGTPVANPRAVIDKPVKGGYTISVATLWRGMTYECCSPNGQSGIKDIGVRYALMSFCFG